MSPAQRRAGWEPGVQEATHNTGNLASTPGEDGEAGADGHAQSWNNNDTV